jgi:hypothetical protein
MANQTIKFGSNFGQFHWEAEANVTDEMLTILAPLGALQVAQRSPSTAAEKAMAGYEKRPKGFDRNSIPFSEEGAKTLSDCLSSMKIETGRTAKDEPIFTTLECVVEVTEKPETGDAASKFTAERAKYASKKGDKEALKKLASAVDYDGELGDGTAEGAPEDFLKAIRAWVRAQAEQL